VADQRSPRDGRFIETIGHYNPQTDPSTIRIDAERLDHWLARGAQATNTVKQLMKAQTKAGGPTPLDAPAATAVADAPEPEAAPEEPAAEAEAAWVQTIVDLSLMREAFLKECTPGYYNNEGKPEVIAKQNGSYGAGPVAFVKVLEAWREAGTLEGLELTQ